MHSILAARTGFSLGESILSVDQLVESAKAAGESVVGITDTMSATALIDLSMKAKKAGIKALIGTRLRIVDDVSWRKVRGDKSRQREYFVNWHVLSELGLQGLFRLLTIANGEDHFYSNAKLSLDDFFGELEKLSPKDVAISTGDAWNIIHHKDAFDILERISAHLGRKNIFLTLNPVNTPYWDTLNRRTISMREDFGLEAEFLVSRPCLYARNSADAAEIMGAVYQNGRLSDPWHPSSVTRDLHPCSLKELAGEIKQSAARLKDRVSNAGAAFSEGIKNTARLAVMSQYEWKRQPVSLPKMAENEFDQLVAECKLGWTKRFSSEVFGHKPSKAELSEIYRPRLAFELETLKRLNFSGYFLLVQDIVGFAKKNGIAVGPGRGSISGSLVAYLMGITDADPIRFNLLFERFINPDRIDLPDADLDFMSERRHEIVSYLIDKYGKERVAGISNFGTLGPSSAIRDVSRVLDIPEAEYRCSKLVPKLHGQSYSLEESAEQVSDIGKFRDRYKGVWKTCLDLEGTIRNLSQHAAGVVVGGCDLVERAAIELRKGERVVCFDKRTVEDQGLVKMDILGLSTLDLIVLTLKYIRERHSKKVDMLKIPLDDPKVLKLFADGDTTGIFQFSSSGIKKLLRELGADGTLSFNDIVAATALYRPGPMDSGMMESYYKRKQGREYVDYDHPKMASILKDTYGVMVFQESVMQVAREVAGYTLAEADVLRKIMGKKEPDKMAEQREKFVKGCVDVSEMEEYRAEELFDKIAKFAGYGFNKSHATTYGIVSYQSAWLKVNFPVEFFAAALTLMKDDELPGLLADAKKQGIDVMYPDINTSTARFEIITDTRVCIPFTRVKGIAERTATALVNERRVNGPFASRADVAARVAPKKCNAGHYEKLTKIGAFASVEPGDKPQRDPSRITDQRELIPGLVVDVTPVERELKRDRDTKAAILSLMNEWRANHGPEGDGDGWPVKIGFGKNAAFMCVTDAPTREEEEMGMSYGTMFGAVTEAMSEVGLSRQFGYWTALIKRPKEGKQVSPSEIAKYEPYFAREMELLKPPIVVLMGSTVARHFIPDIKGKVSDMAGKIVYNKEMDLNFVIGFSPGEVHYAPEKQESMNAVFASVARLLGVADEETSED